MTSSRTDTLSFYDDFRTFLAVESAFDDAHKRKLQQNRAQQKLLRLSANQFYELATDVHDELTRRLSTAVEYLAPKDELHPKRNHARKKLSLLSETRFNDLAFDILFEIERRNPNLKRLPKGRPLSEEFAEPVTPTTPAMRVSTNHNHQLSTSTNSTFFSDAPTPVNDAYASDISSPHSPFDSSTIKVELDSPALINPPAFYESPPQSPTHIPTATATLTPTKSTLVEDSEESELSEDEFRPENPVPGINAAMQAWAYKNSSQADLTSLNSGFPKIQFSSDEDEGSDDDGYGLAQDFNVNQFGQNYNQSDELDDMTTSLGGYNMSTAYDAMEAELMNRSHPLTSIEEEKSPYIPPALIIKSRTNQNSDKRRSLSETMSSSIPGGIRSRSLNKIDHQLADYSNSTPNLSSAKQNDYEQALKAKDSQILEYQRVIIDKDEQIGVLVEEGTRLNMNLSKLSTQIAETETLKDSLLEENGRLHQMIGQCEMDKDNIITELEATKNEFNVQHQAYIIELEESQSKNSTLEIQYQKLKEKHADVLYKQTEFAGSSASLSSQILLLESKLIKQETVSYLSEI